MESKRISMHAYWSQRASSSDSSAALARKRSGPPTPSCRLKRPFESGSVGAFGIVGRNQKPQWWGHLLDRRNDFKRSFDAKLFLAISALMTMPILWLTKTHLGACPSNHIDHRILK